MKINKHYPCIIFVIFMTFNIFGEGTRELMPINGGANGGSIQITGNVNAGSTFARFGGATTQRLNIHICEIGEIINLGFEALPSWEFRVLDPTGNVVIPITSMNFTAANSPGRINNYNQAVAGPNTLNAAGYVPITLTTNTIGDYYVEFRTNVAGSNIINLWDITVTNNNLEKKGRVWSASWLLTTGAFTNKFNANLYVYTTDLITTMINFNGIAPYEFIITSNSTGTSKIGTVAQNRQSIFGNNTYPEYKIFLNEPDTNCYATGDLGEIDGDPYITGCPGNYCINVAVTAPGNMQFLIDVNGTPGFQNNSADRLIQANLKKGYNCVPWDGKDGLGNLVTSATTIDLSIQYMNGLTHLPIYDVENHENGYSISYVRPIPVSAGANIDVYWDDTRINTDGNQLDGLTNLNGCKSANGCHKWSNRGGNNNNSPTVNTWWYVKESSASIAYEDNNVAVDANIYKPGKGSKNDISYCASIDSVLINGGEDGDGFIKWTSLVGTGSFADDTLLTNYYKLSAADKLRPFVQLRIQNKVGVCPPVYDTIKIFLEPQKNLDLKPVADKCKDLPNFTISATKSNILGPISWTNAGTILQTSTSTTLSVIPTASDLSKDSITIKAVSNDVVVHCPNVSDSVKVKFYTASNIALPKDTIFCTGASTLNLPVIAKTTNNPSSINWQAINATPTPNTGPNTSLNLTGTSAQVRLIATASKTGCNSRSDTMFVNFTEKPTVDIIDVNPLCSTVDSITLNSNVTNTSNSLWKGGSGLFKNKNTSKTVYFPSLAEKTSGGDITLTLLANGNSPCKPDSDKTVINLVKIAKITVDSIAPICANITNLQLKAKSENAIKTTWSGGSGSYLNASSENATYIPTSVENENSTVKFYINVASENPCPSILDSVIVKMAQLPQLTITPLNEICENQTNITLNATAQHTIKTEWKIKNGSYTDASLLNTVYSFTPFELLDDSAIFIIEASGADICPKAADTTQLDIKHVPAISINTITDICSTTDSMKISATGTNYSNISWTIGSGIMKKNTLSDIMYFPSLAEKTNSTVNVAALASGATVCPSSSDFKSFNIIAAPKVKINPTSIYCENVSTIPLTATIANGNSLIWNSIGNGTIDITGSNSINYTPSNTDKTANLAYIYASLAGSSPCSATNDSIEIKLIPLPELNGKNVQGFCADIDSIQVISFSKNTTGILWQGSGGFFSNPIKDTTFYHPSKNELSNGQTTLYILASAITPCNNLKDTISAIFILPPSVIIDSVGPFCADVNNIALTAKVQNASNVVWTGGTGSIANNSSTNTTYSPSITEKKGSSFPISLVATANAPCKNVSKTFKLTINPLPIVTNTTIPFCNEGDNSILIDGGDATKYLWLKNGDTTRKKSVSGYETFDVKVKNQFGCEAIRTVTTIEECPPRLFISNGFSPNGDGVNDFYNVYGAHIGKFEMLIFSRWGEVIFRSTDINKAWDGIYKDEPMPLGTYQWKIEYEGETETYKGPYFKKGSVTIVR